MTLTSITRRQRVSAKQSCVSAKPISVNAKRTCASAKRLCVSAIAGLFASAAIAPASAADIVYAWADKPSTANYNASTSYAYSPGKTVKVQRTAKGQYTVRFGQNAGAGANVQVVAYGPEPGHCNVRSWGGGAANILCIDGGGQTIDRRFLAMAIKASAADAGKVAYAWLNEESSASYQASASYRFGAGAMQVTRSGPGAYSVNLGALVGPGATVLVTAYDSRALCNVVNWGGGSVNINCKGWTGGQFDTKLSVLAIGPGLAKTSFVWNSSIAGQASPQYSHASNGAAQSVTRTGPGRYTVALGPEAGPGGHVQAGAYGSDASCWINNYSGGKAYVRCAQGGTLADSRFVVAGFKGGGLVLTPGPVLDPGPVYTPTLTEDCINFSNASATLKRVNNSWKIVDGDHWMFDFGSNQVEGALALNYIKHYGANQTCFVGRPGPSMTYLLKSGAALTGTGYGEDCISWNLNTVEAKFVSGQWKLVDGSHWILSFPNEAEANQALAIVKHHQFTKQCFVGRPDPNFTYFKK